MLGLIGALLGVGCDGGTTDGDAGEVLGDDPAAHCEPREPVGCALDLGGFLPRTMEGTTIGGDDGFSGSRCGIGGGVAVEDVAFRWTAPRAGLYRFTTEGSGFDTILSARTSCSAREMACNDDALEGSGYSSLAMPLEECETVTLVIDGYDAEGVGAYRFHVDASEASCSDGVDDDGDGATDCDDSDCFGPRCDVANGDWPDDWRVFEGGVYELVNQQRARGAVCDGQEMPPVGPLERDELLEVAARRHSFDMAENRYFSHDSLDGRMVADRTREVGFASAFVGENIAQGYTTAEEAMAGWMSSPGHCLNIMDPAWDVIGVGYAYPDGADGPYWTQDFGSL